MYQNAKRALLYQISFLVAAVNVVIDRNYLTDNDTLKVKTFNVFPKICCPGKTAWCLVNCYACKGRYIRDSVREAMSYRTLETLMPHFAPAMVSEIKRLRNKVVRIHSSGDFYSLEYLRKWIAIAKACPECTFFTYTRTWHLPEFLPHLQELASLQNVTVWCSVDPSDKVIPDWDKIAYIEGSKDAPSPNCLKQHEKGESCRTCKRCYDGTNKAITFLVH